MLRIAMLHLCVLVGLMATGELARAQNVSGYDSMAEPLLFLLREPAVHADLQLSESQLAELVAFNETVDGQLLALRNGDRENSKKVASEVIAKSRDYVSKSFTPLQQKRLRQLIYRVRGISFVLSPDAAAELQLTASQKEQAQAIVQRTWEAVAAAQSPTFEGQEAYQKSQSAVLEIRRREQKDILGVLDETQKRTLISLVGANFDPSTLGRVSFRSPEITGGTEWINSQALELKQLRGKVVAVHFWAFGCINCIRNQAWYRDWHESYADRGLVLVGVHTPETTVEHDVEQLREKVKEARFAFPVVADNDKAIWNAWGNSMWPSVYLVDKTGRLRYWWYGELDWNGAGGHAIMAQKIEELLAE